MPFRSNAIDGTFANGNHRGRHHDGHAARPLLGQDAHDIVFYVSILIGILALWPEDAVGRRRRDRAPGHQQRDYSSCSTRSISAASRSIPRRSSSTRRHHPPGLCSRLSSSSSSRIVEVVWGVIYKSWPREPPAEPQLAPTCACACSCMCIAEVSTLCAVELLC